MKPIGGLIFFFLILLIYSFGVKYLWSYLVVRLFPGAVEQNLIAKSISWKDSIILGMIFLMITQG